MILKSYCPSAPSHLEVHSPHQGEYSNSPLQCAKHGFLQPAAGRTRNVQVAQVRPLCRSLATVEASCKISRTCLIMVAKLEGTTSCTNVFLFLLKLWRMMPVLDPSSLFPTPAIDSIPGFFFLFILSDAIVTRMSNLIEHIHRSM